MTEDFVKWFIVGGILLAGAAMMILAWQHEQRVKRRMIAKMLHQQMRMQQQAKQKSFMLNQPLRPNPGQKFAPAQDSTFAEVMSAQTSTEIPPPPQQQLSSMVESDQFSDVGIGQNPELTDQLPSDVVSTSESHDVRDDDHEAEIAETKSYVDSQSSMSMESAVSSVAKGQFDMLPDTKPRLNPVTPIQKATDRFDHPGGSRTAEFDALEQDEAITSASHRRGPKDGAA